MTPIGGGMKVLGYFAGKRSAKAEMEFDLYCAYIASGQDTKTAMNLSKMALGEWRDAKSGAEIRAIETEVSRMFDPADGGG